jgi:hypothetical protein
MSSRFRSSNRSPAKGLPIVRISGIRYFLDVPYRQLRQVDDLSDVIDLDGEGFIEVDGDDE